MKTIESVQPLSSLCKVTLRQQVSAFDLFFLFGVAWLAGTISIMTIIEPVVPIWALLACDALVVVLAVLLWVRDFGPASPFRY